MPATIHEAAVPEAYSVDIGFARVNEHFVGTYKSPHVRGELAEMDNFYNLAMIDLRMLMADAPYDGAVKVTVHLDYRLSDQHKGLARAMFGQCEGEAITVHIQEEHLGTEPKTSRGIARLF
jgi:hypothetical protein